MGCWGGGRRGVGMGRRLQAAGRMPRRLPPPPPLPTACRAPAPLRSRPACSAVESEVAANEGQALHSLLGDECERKAAAEAAALAAALALDATAFLQHVVASWEAYSSQLSLIRRVPATS